MTTGPMGTLIEVIAILFPFIGSVAAVWWTQKRADHRSYVEDLIEGRDKDRARIDALEAKMSAMQALVLKLRAQEALWRVIYAQQNIEIERLGGTPVSLPPALAGIDDSTI